MENMLLCVDRALRWIHIFVDNSGQSYKALDDHNLRL